MIIDFESPLYPVDDNYGSAFSELLNLILVAEHIVDLNGKLITRNNIYRFGALSGYFKWTFSFDTFTVWQRMAYGSEYCFEKRIFALKFTAFVNPARTKLNLVNS